MKPGDIGLEKRSKKHISLWKMHQIHFHPPSTLEPSCQSKWPHRLMSPFASIKNFTCCWSSAFPEKITTLRLPKPALKGVDQKTPFKTKSKDLLLRSFEHFSLLPFLRNDHQLVLEGAILLKIFMLFTSKFHRLLAFLIPVAIGWNC